jgi:hypothetical protein
MLTGHNVDRLARGQHHRQRDVATPKELRMSLSYLNIAPLGTRLDGRPIWPFTGAAPDGDGGGEGGDGDGGDGDGDGGDDGNEPDPDSTEGLKKALERERESVKQKSRELRGFKTLMRDTGVKTFDDFKAKVTGGSGTGTGSKGGGNGQQQQETVDVEAIKEAARNEARAEANAAAAKSITEAKIEALATKGFMTPRDAVLALRDDLEDLITDDGKPDVPAINRALASLLKDRPHWKKDTVTGATDYDGGSRQTAPATNGFSAQLRQESRNKRGK